LIHLDNIQWALALLAALIAGFSKTGMPGIGILVVPLMANVFPGRLSVGATLPILITADICAVSTYHKDVDWSKLKSLAPFVVAGLLAGTFFLAELPRPKGGHDPLNPIIGVLVLLMLALQLMRKKLGDRMLPTSKTGTGLTGIAAGFSTMASNAAGPIMSIYMTATGLPKHKFISTTAWYFFIFNLSKVPLQILLNHLRPSDPMFSDQSMLLALFVAPVVVIGALSGRALLHRIPEKIFTDAVLILAAVGAIKLALT